MPTAVLNRKSRPRPSTPGPKPKTKKLTRTQQPPEMTLEEWQIALRREFGRAQDFELKNLGSQPIFSDFALTNPQSGRTYRVAVRGEALGDSRCTCPDFATNTLGTCKHVEFTLERLRQKRGGCGALRRGWLPPHGEVWLRYGAERHVVFRVGSTASSAMRQVATRYFEADGTLRRDAFPHFEQFLAEAGRLRHPVTCEPEALDFIAQVRDAAWRGQVLAERYADPTRIDDLVKTTLYSYQRDGVRFAARAGRALLGDEMGLGKTVQAVALAELMAREFGVERVLIICPASLKYQWKQEIEKFTDRSALVLDGVTHQRRAGYEDGAFFKIVNYDVVHRDLEAIARMEPDLVILDEAQRIKNWKTRAAQAVKSIASPYALVLTGTPLENRLEELHSIVQFVDQQRLGPLFRFLATHQVKTGESTRVVGYQNLSAIGETLKPILLRRRKREVLDQLPGRTDKTFFVPMTPEQSNLHAENREIVAKLVSRWNRQKFLSESDQRRLTIALLRMRMACDNTFLVDHVTRFGTKLDELRTVLAEIFEDPEARVVIFSQWARMNDLVAEMLEAQDWSYVYLHGGVPSRERKHLLEKFRQPGTRVFLSTDAGGVGLNLQSASVVINLDLPWNPAVLEQRIGRVYRLGQQRSVNVINFVSEGTIEHGMLNVLAFKSSLFAGVLDGGEDAIFLEGSRLNTFMKSIEAVSGAVPLVAAPGAEDADPTTTPSEAGEDTIELTGAAEALRLTPAAAGAQATSSGGSAAADGQATSPGGPAAGARPADPSGSASGAAPPTPATHPHPNGTAASPDTPPEIAALQPLLEAGAALLRGLGQALASRDETSASTAPAAERSGPAVTVTRDPQTGLSRVSLPLPEPETLQKLAAAAAPLVEALRGMFAATRS